MLAAVIASSGLARAAETEPMVDVVETPPPGPAPGAFEHDGFYLRLGAGFSAFGTAIVSDDENVANEHSEGTVTGLGAVGELMLGGAVTRRLIVGGGFWTSTMLSDEFDQQNGNPVPNQLRDPDYFALTGPFVDWYFGYQAHHAGAGGWHMQGAFGFAALAGNLHNEEDDRLSVGGGVMFGVGYDWWVHEQWKLGMLGRIMTAGLIDDDVRGDTWYRGVASFPELLFTATYN